MSPRWKARYAPPKPGPTVEPMADPASDPAALAKLQREMRYSRFARQLRAQQQGTEAKPQPPPSSGAGPERIPPPAQPPAGDDWD